jgi:ribonucleotide reductase alpha subunit
MSGNVESEVKIYNRDEVYKSTIKYFDNDELATNSWINKYCLKDSEGNFYELNPDDMHNRLASEIHRIEKKYPKPLNQDVIFNLIKDFKYIIPQGGPMSGIGNNKQVSSLSNCFVIGNEYDSYGGIFRVDEQQVQLMKRRGGVGHDLSHIRPEGSSVKNSALTSTGIVPFMERYSNSTREVAQDGRRGALMLSLSIKHPDSEKFIDAKLIEGKVTGANISVKLTDDFVNAVLEDKPYIQQYPIDSDHPTLKKEIDPKRLWDKIIHNAWKSAEPGVLFWDQIIRESPADCYSKQGFKTISTNPCFPDYLQVLSKSKGLITIKDLEIGDEIYSMEGWTKVINKFSTGIKFVNEYHTIIGSIPLTEDHLVLTNKGSEKIPIKDAKQLEYFYTSNGDDLNIDNRDIIRVIPLGEMEVWDITVDNNSHSFMGNYFNISNCGEIPLSFGDSCRLLSINLLSYVKSPFTKNAKFDEELFKEHVKYAQRISDDIIDLEIEKIDRILEKIKSDPEPKTIKFPEIELWEKIKESAINGRRIGLGITAEGDMLAALGLRYGSDESIEFSKKVHKIIATYSYISSVELAKDREPFKVWDSELEKNNPFIKRVLLENDEVPKEIINQYYKTGRRNISCLTIAPTGTVSIMTQTSSGIEPTFGVRYIRKRKINPNDKGVNVDEIERDEQGDAWEKYTVYHHGFIKWAKINKQDLNDISNEEYEKIYESSPYYKATSSDVDWVAKVKMQGEIQKWVDHSISVTVNLPENITEEIVSKVYMTAWQCGCKGITVYREGSRQGVLTTMNKKNSDESKETTAPKRPKVLECDVIKFNNKGEKWVGIMGVLNGRPYELFTGKSDSFNIPDKIDIGHVIRVKDDDRSRYDFQYTDKDGYKVTMEGLNRAFSSEYWNYGRLISGILRHGMPLKYVYDIVDSLKMDETEDVFTWKSGVKRLIKKYIKDGTKTKEICPNCGADVIFSEGCKKCSNNCGWNKCDL